MSTIKSFTSPKQSKLLAEILPIESADMAYWKKSCRPNDYAIMAHHTKELQEGFEAKGMEYIPCWSLVALLAQMPCVELVSSQDNKYRVFWKDRFSEWQDNPVDACVELLERVRKEE